MTSNHDANQGGAIFLVGPGGVGKTTVGPLLAGLTAREFVDLDARFCTEIGVVDTVIAEQGYRAYCEANSELAAQIVNESRVSGPRPGNVVMATSSGFLAHHGCDDIVERNLALIRNTGTSVFLLPAADLDDAARVLTFRQVQRFPNRDVVAEYLIAHDRCGRYMASSDRMVLADCMPHEVANRIVVELMMGGADLVGAAHRASYERKS